MLWDETQTGKPTGEESMELMETSIEERVRNAFVSTEPISCSVVPDTLSAEGPMLGRVSGSIRDETGSADEEDGAEDGAHEGVWLAIVTEAADAERIGAGGV